MSRRRWSWTTTPSLDLNAYVSNDELDLPRLREERQPTNAATRRIGDVTSELTDVTEKLVAAPIQPRTFGIEVDYRF